MLFLFLAWSPSMLASGEDVNGISFIELDLEHATCGGSGGSVSFQITGGVQPYLVEFQGTVATLVGDIWSADELAQGDYLLEVTDALGCQSAISWQLVELPLEVSIECGAVPGSLEINVPFGVAPYSYLWDNGVIANGVIMDLTTGIYSITVTDANGCIGVVNYNYVEPSDPFIVNCNQLINLSLGAGVDGVTTIIPDMLIEGPYPECSSDIEFNLVDNSGNVIADYASSQNVDCSHVGNIIYNLRDNISGYTCSGSILLEGFISVVPICVNSSTVILDANQETVISAIEYDAGSYEVCSSGSLRFTFSSTPPDQDPDFDASIGSSFRTLDCDDFTISNNGQFLVDIYVWDESGNSDYCTINLNILNSSNPCEVNNDYVQVIWGLCNNPPLDRYNLNLNGVELSNSACIYPIDPSELSVGTNEITIENNGLLDNLLNGISTLDLVFISRGLVHGFDTDWEIVASDFDGDAAVSTKDLIEMRRYIVALESEELYQQYKLIDADHDFSGNFGPFNLGSTFSSIEFNDTDLESNPINVIILKSGDINNSATLTSEEMPTSREASSISYKDLSIIAGETYTIDFELVSSTEFKAATFELLASDLNILSVEDYGNDLVFNNKISSVGFSYFTDHPEDSFLFSLEIEALVDGQLSHLLSLNSDFLKEIVDNDLNEGAISLSANGLTGSEELIDDLFTISPNPVKDVLNISFDNESGNSTRFIELININGKSINSYKTTASEFSIDVASLNTSGLILVRVIQDGKMKVERVIIE